MQPERHRAQRYVFVATIELTDLQSETQMKEQRQAESGGMLGKDISGLTGYSFNQGAVLLLLSPCFIP